MKKILITIISVLAVIALIAWILNNNKKKNEEQTNIVAQGSSGDVAVKIEKASLQTADMNFNANGTFEARQDLTLAAESAGRITRFTVNEGDHVRKGQVVARIDDEILGIESQNAQASLDNAKRDLQRYESSFKTGGVTQQQVDQQRLAVTNAQARLQTARRKTNDADVKAPISGTVNKRFIENGSYVTAGAQLFEIVDISTLKLKVNVNESQVVNLQKGGSVKIICNVFPDKNFTGTINFIAAKADESLNFPIEILVSNNTANELRAGMYGTAVFELPQQKPSILLSRSAFVGSVSSNKVFIYENGQARERSVIAGRVIGEKVEIIKGISPGEQVIVSGQINLVDGTKVQIAK